MRKILPIIFFLSFSSVLSAQWYGDGLTAGTAYYGVINGAYTMQTWNISNYPGGVIYVGLSTAGQNDLEVASGGTLTIQQGITVKFCTTASDLIITGTGVLSASGISTNPILFTKDIQASWGHISFEASTGSSVINYCTIEYGRKTGAGIEGYGGGIHANTSALAISNSTIRNNYALFGGGLFVNTGKNPAINNCYVYNNKALHGGGGFYFWNSSSSVIKNCIFDSNQCLEPATSYYTGGGLTAQTNCSIKVVNCTFVNNTSTRPEGQALLLHLSSNSRVINSIFWGTSDKQIYCYGTSGGTIINCAYRGITQTTGVAPVNPVILNSLNNASDGPNFNATNGSDWSIKFISPCRDAGINSYTGVTIPPTDYIGNLTIGTKDIGAYEVQYSRWKTTASSTDWSTVSNWEGGVPTNNRDVVIPSGASSYPTGSTTQDFTLGANKLLIIEPGSKLTLNAFYNYGTLRLNSNSSAIASLIINSYTRETGGTEEIQLYLTGGYIGDPSYQIGRWHYISSPVSSLPVSTFAPGTTLDVAAWYEERPTLSLNQGWVAYDGYVYPDGTGTGPTFTNFSPGVGYNYWDDKNNTFTFSGLLNTADVPITLKYTTRSNMTLAGFNLRGNPFSSGLDWDQIINDPLFPATTSKGLYFTRENEQCSYISGVGYPDASVTGIIPPMQGFFTKTYSLENITFPASARVHDVIPSRYKGATIIPLIRLAITDPDIKDNTVIRFDEKADAGWDNNFDAVRMFLSSSKTYIYSSSPGINYSINGQPFPQASVEIPIVINLLTTGNHSISTTQLQGLGSYKVTLTDNNTGFTANLNTTPVLTFSASAGLIKDRFILKVSNVTTGTEDPVSSDGIFNIYPSFGLLNIQTIADEWEGKTGSVKVLDLTGKIVSNLDNTAFSKNSLISVPAKVAKGIYVVEIRAGVKRYVGKVVIR